MGSMRDGLVLMAAWVFGVVALLAMVGPAVEFYAWAWDTVRPGVR